MSIFKNISKSIILVLVLLSAASCNDSDNITEIFIGHDWKLTYIEDGGGKRWPQGKIYSLMFGETTFNAYTPTGGKIRGQWSANGKTREFRCTSIRTEGISANDTIAMGMLQMFNDATYYDGDIHYLQIKKDEKHYMQFYNR